MEKEVILTPLALEDFNNVIEYLTENWDIVTTRKFILRFERIIILLSNNPGIFPYFDKSKELQKCLVTKHNVIYFKETKHVVRIITIFDTRQNPKKLSSII